MTHDKKNTSGTINFTLLKNIGDIRINQIADKDTIFECWTSTVNAWESDPVRTKNKNIGNGFNTPLPFLIPYSPIYIDNLHHNHPHFLNPNDSFDTGQYMTSCVSKKTSKRRLISKVRPNRNFLNIQTRVFQQSLYLQYNIFNNPVFSRLSARFLDYHGQVFE